MASKAGPGLPILLLAAGLTLGGCAEPPAPGPAATADGPFRRLVTAPASVQVTELQGEEAIIRRHGFDPEQVGFVVLDGESRRELAALRPDEPFVPASAAKLVTALAALDVLGPAHRFETALLARGKVRNGTLEGDLVLVGGGDPKLLAPDLLALALQLRRAGIARVSGRFLFDDSLLPLVAEIDPAQPDAAAYNAGVGALASELNRVTLRWRKAQAAGDALEAYAVPPLAGARLQLAEPGEVPRGGIDARIDGDGGMVWRLAAEREARGAVPLPVHDPGLQTAALFRELGARAGVVLPGPVRGTAPKDARPLARHTSPELSELVADMLRYSNNQMAETIGLGVGRTLAARPVAPKLSARLTVERVIKRLPGLDPEGLALANHSGLGTGSKVTARQLALLLAKALEKGAPQPALASLLPTGGFDGTLAQRFDTPDRVLRVWAKTGSMAYVSTLAGYLLPGDGGPLAFALLINDAEARKGYDAAIGEPAAEAESAAWGRRAKALEDDLVAWWLARG